MVAAISSRWLGALLCAAALIGLGAPGPTQAQDYPVKPVRLVVGTAAGGVVDIRARKLGPRLGEILKQQASTDDVVFGPAERFHAYLAASKAAFARAAELDPTDMASTLNAAELGEDGSEDPDSEELDA